MLVVEGEASKVVPAVYRYLWKATASCLLRLLGPAMNGVVA